MVKIRIIMFTAMFIAMSLGSASARILKLTIDERNWYPFTYVENNTPMGMHVELVKKALENLDYQIEIDYLPRRRCLFSIEQGSVDAMISISYNQEISGSIDFPKDADKPGESEWRIMQVDHVVVTAINNYEFDGKIESLPEPVRIPYGESLTTEITAKGKLTDEAKTDEQNFGKMLRDQNGCVITTTMIAEKMALDPKYSGKIYIHSIPIASLSYHLGFSKKSTLTSEEKQKIWDEIKKWRNDYVFMLQLYSQY